MKENLSPLMLFVYNRPEHTFQTLKALEKNYLATNTDLFIFSDGPKLDEPTRKVSDVRKIIRETKGFQNITIIEREKNWGLAKSVISGVSEIIEKYGKAIILEDDLISSRTFLSYMNNALDEYKNNPQVFSISGYSYPIQLPKEYPYDVYLSLRSSSWGWATWYDRWAKADWEVRDYADFIKNPSKQIQFNEAGGDFSGMLQKQMEGKLDSWGIRWAYTHFLNNSFCLYPVKSQIYNIGADGSGTHVSATNKWSVDFNMEGNEVRMEPNLQLSNDIVKATKAFFKVPLLKRIISKVKGIIKL